MQDSALVLKAAATGITATFSTTGLDITQGVGGFAPGDAGLPVVVKIPITSLDHTTGDETYSFKLQDSPDNSTWTDISATRLASDYGGPNANSTTGTVLVGGFLRQRYVRMTATLGGTTPILATNDIYLEPLVNHMA